MKLKLLFAIAFIGIVGSLVAVRLFSITHPPLPPLHTPPTDPYSNGIYAEGIVESEQASGKNINVYPEVSGTVAKVLVSEGQEVKKGMPLLLIDDSIQLAATEQVRLQARAAGSLLEELKAEPRKENLDIAAAQVYAAQASLRTANDTLAKQKASYAMDPKSVSTDTLDSAINAVRLAGANLEVAKKQYALTKAGAWAYDIRNQESQYAALEASYRSSRALLSRYTLRAPRDGVVLVIDTGAGSYASPQGAYDPYTQGSDPVLVLGSPQASLQVRCYVDEILVPRLPAPSAMKAQMQIRGSNLRLPLTFVSTQPYVSPKIELSDERQERVDVRVLPVIFRFEKPRNTNLYPGELVDVYIQSR
jgi:HlyD family secretion protein